MFDTLTKKEGSPVGEFSFLMINLIIRLILNF